MTTARPEGLERDGHPRPGYARTDGAVIVPDEVASVVRAEPTYNPLPIRDPSDVIVRLREGAMLFVPSEGDVSWHARMGRWPARHGKRVRQRRAVYEGQTGHYVWLEDRAPGEERRPRNRSKR